MKSLEIDIPFEFTGTGNRAGVVRTDWLQLQLNRQAYAVKPNIIARVIATLNVDAGSAFNAQVNLALERSASNRESTSLWPVWVHRPGYELTGPSWYVPQPSNAFALTAVCYLGNGEQVNDARVLRCWLSVDNPAANWSVVGTITVAQDVDPEDAC